MVLITGATGATGQLGRAVLDRPLQGTAPRQVAALVRDPGKAVELEARDGSIQMRDYDDTVLRRGKP